MLKRFLCSEEGQATTEYGLILVLIAVIAVAVVAALGRGVTNTFETSNGKMPG